VRSRDGIWVCWRIYVGALRSLLVQRLMTGECGILSLTRKWLSLWSQEQNSIPKSEIRLEFIKHPKSFDEREYRAVVSPLYFHSSNQPTNVPSWLYSPFPFCVSCWRT
jgi:hypothetical protein